MLLLIQDEDVSKSPYQKDYGMSNMITNQIALIANYGFRKARF